MKQEIRIPHHIISRMHTIALLVSMAGLLSLLGWFLAGFSGIKTALIITALAFAFTPRMPSRLTMKSLRARPLNPRVVPGLYAITGKLSGRAGLDRAPDLYYLPSPKLNAFSAGSGKDSAIGITHGLLSALTTREMAGILSHEITHIKNNDMQIMALSAVFGRITGYLSLAGQILLLMSVPLAISGAMEISFLPLLLMIFAPAISTMLYFALSRTREFEADLGSLTLLNDPHALASALSKVEQSQLNGWRRMFIPLAAKPAPLLQSHPATKERVRRLLEMKPPRPYRQGGDSDHGVGSRYTSIPIYPQWR
ncbi:MAG: zinc metalloprotease HtpX [Desulfobacterales bacterium]|nr:zinc metalloprotease HtpX [Desulfobacterales bacterium]